MQSRLIVALCVVGSLYAVQAKPHVGIERDIEGPFEAMSTYQLTNAAYLKLNTLIDALSTDETLALRECLTKFAQACDERRERDRDLFVQGYAGSESYESQTLRKLVDFVRVIHISTLGHLTEGEIEHLRTVLIKFMNDQTPDVMYYIEHGWSTVFRTVEEYSIKELLYEVVRKLFVLHNYAWDTKNTEVNNVLVRIIKRADEEIIKCDAIKFEELIRSMPYEILDAQPVRALVGQAYLRFKGLFRCYWQEESTTYKTILVNFIKTLDELIVKYNRIE